MAILNCGGNFLNPVTDNIESCNCLCILLDALDVGQTENSIFEDTLISCTGGLVDFTYNDKNFSCTLSYTSPANPSGNNRAIDVYDVTRLEDTTTSTSTTDPPPPPPPTTSTSTSTSTSTTLSGTTTPPPTTPPPTTTSPTSTTSNCCAPPPNPPVINPPTIPPFTTRSIPPLTINVTLPPTINPFTDKIVTTTQTTTLTTTLIPMTSTTQQIKIECVEYCKKLGF